ncbi:unnamed protein product [Cylicocyclus nassatus]|uniref:C2H2-type domain-containing protein n=1 Tax=Cylicocyclus nassatus TaxID=53992 RepID=A0AA36GYG1_CYLNA|nr:unnamed protein product [Cylicocyclus nassatus]
MDSDNLLMLADVAKLDNEERPLNCEVDSTTNVYTSNTNAFDHCYFSSSDFDRFVNPTHDYYRRIGLGDFRDQEHSYAFQIPITQTSGQELQSTPETDDLLDFHALHMNGITLHPYKCCWGVCELEFGNIEELQRHAESHVDLKCRRCEWRECNKYTDCYAHRYLLIRHLRSHTGSTPYACEQCGARFSTRERIRLHVRAVHAPEVKYKCEICDRFYKTTSERRHHMVRTHMLERLSCQYCGGLYAGSTVLKRHLKKSLPSLRAHVTSELLSNSCVPIVKSFFSGAVKIFNNV